MPDPRHGWRGGQASPTTWHRVPGPATRERPAIAMGNAARVVQGMAYIRWISGVEQRPGSGLGYCPEILVTADRDSRSSAILSIGYDSLELTLARPHCPRSMARKRSPIAETRCPTSTVLTERGYARVRTARTPSAKPGFKAGEGVGRPLASAGTTPTCSSAITGVTRLKADYTDIDAVQRRRRLRSQPQGACSVPLNPSVTVINQPREYRETRALSPRIQQVNAGLDRTNWSRVRDGRNCTTRRV